MLCKRKQTPPYWWWCLPTLPATLVKKCNLRANKVPACEENRLMAKGDVTPAGISEQRAWNLWPWLCPSLITGEWPWGQNGKQMFSLASSWLLYLWPFNSWIPQTHTFPVIRPPPNTHNSALLSGSLPCSLLLHPFCTRIHTPVPASAELIYFFLRN